LDQITEEYLKLGKQYKTLIYKTGPLYIKQYKEFKENIN
jgi:hypothetical protein